MTQITEEAIDAGIEELARHGWLTDPDEGSICECGRTLMQSLDYAGDAYAHHSMKAVLTAVLPIIARHVRAQVAAEIRQKRDQVNPRTHDLLPSDHHTLGRVAAYERAARIAEGGNHA